MPCTVHTRGSIHIHGQNNAHGPATPPEPVPEAFSLQLPRPNLSAGQAALRFGLPEAADVERVVFDALGREVARLADGSLEAGWHVVRVDGLHLPSGAYFARMTAGTFGQTQRLLIVR